MSRLIFTMALATSVFFIPAFAVEEHHPDKPGNSAKLMPGKDGKAAAGKQAGMSTGMMQDSMLKMHEMMHKIMQTGDPREREKLKQEHLRLMRDHMEMMSGMMGPGMPKQ